MEGKLVRWGDDLAVRVPAHEAEQFGLHEGQTVELTPKDGAPGNDAAPMGERAGRRYVNGLPVYTLEEMFEEMRRLGPAYEPETVDWGPDRGSEIIDDDDPR